MFDCLAPVVQWIGRNFAEVMMQVRFLLEPQNRELKIVAFLGNLWYCITQILFKLFFIN